MKRIQSRSFKWLLGIGVIGASAVVLFAGFLNGSSSEGYVAHEWGTFTSVQGGDGVLLDWRPLETSRLPNFVHDWTRPGLNRRSVGANPLTKNVLVTLQRMETPVIYFYSDQDRTVDVAVDFPKGTITEWYPQARQIGPSVVPVPETVAKLDNVAHRVGAKPEFTFASLVNNGATKTSRALWKHVEILKTNPESAGSLRTDTSGSHYFAARETDANLLRVSSLDTNPAPEIEKFIFYRGVGSFATPLFVTTTADHAVTISNNGSEPLDHLYLLGVDNKTGAFVHVSRLNPGEHRTLALDPARSSLSINKLSRQISDEIARSLVSEGLYEREAKAMVNTWKDSWFEENGLRVLYILPRVWTDRTLPIAMNPAPRDLVRVMVGRAEIIPPDQQQHLATALTQANLGNEQARGEVLSEFKKLGRFSEPALNLATRKSPQNLVQTAWALLQAANKPQIN